MKGNKYKKGGKISRGALIKTTARLKQDQNPSDGFFSIQMLFFATASKKKINCFFFIRNAGVLYENLFERTPEAIGMHGMLNGISPQ